MSRHPGQSDGTYRRHLDDDLLAVECWCQATTVGVPQADVLAGLTRSCGAPACDTHDTAHRNPPKENASS